MVFCSSLHSSWWLAWQASTLQPGIQAATVPVMSRPLSFATPVRAGDGKPAAGTAGIGVARSGALSRIGTELSLKAWTMQVTLRIRA